VGRRSTPFSVDWNAYLDIGTILGKKRYPEATAALQRAVELDLNQPDAHYWLGRVYQSANDEAAAKREFASCVRCTRRRKTTWLPRCFA
jgi:Tfp pilus assembly protein PilF